MRFTDGYEAAAVSFRSQYLKGSRTPECRAANADWMRLYRQRKNGPPVDPETCTFCAKDFSKFGIATHERVCPQR